MEILGIRSGLKNSPNEDCVQLLNAEMQCVAQLPALRDHKDFLTDEAVLAHYDFRAAESSFRVAGILKAEQIVMQWPEAMKIWIESTRAHKLVISIESDQVSLGHQKLLDKDLLELQDALKKLIDEVRSGAQEGLFSSSARKREFSLSDHFTGSVQLMAPGQVASMSTLLCCCLSLGKSYADNYREIFVKGIEDLLPITIQSAKKHKPFSEILFGGRVFVRSHGPVSLTPLGHEIV